MSTFTQKFGAVLLAGATAFGAAGGAKASPGDSVTQTSGNGTPYVQKLEGCVMQAMGPGARSEVNDFGKVFRGKDFSPVVTVKDNTMDILALGSNNRENTGIIVPDVKDLNKASMVSGSSQTGDQAKKILSSVRACMAPGKS